MIEVCSPQVSFNTSSHYAAGNWYVPLRIRRTNIYIDFPTTALHTGGNQNLSTLTNEHPVLFIIVNFYSILQVCNLHGQLFFLSLALIGTCFSWFFSDPLSLFLIDPSLPSSVSLSLFLGGTSFTSSSGPLAFFWFGLFPSFPSCSFLLPFFFCACTLYSEISLCLLTL